MMPRRIRCMKFFLTLFNIIAILFALFLVAVCVINIRDGARPRAQSGQSHGVLAFLLTLALSVLLTALLGCVGALRENLKILYVHACFFIFLVSVELVLAVGGAVLSACLGGGNDLRVQFFRNTTQDEEGNRYAVWDVLQSENHCCGIDGPQDYAILQQEIPSSCCARAHPLREGGARRQLHAICLADRSYYTRGCEDVLLRKNSFMAKVFISIGSLFVLLEILCVITALWMASAVRNERYKLQETLRAHFES